MGTTPEKDTALARVTVPAEMALRPIMGEIKDRVAAYNEIAANMAPLAINGWAKVSDCKAACWMADALGCHPAMFMQGNWCATINGKLTVEPKVEFVLGIIRSRVPGFVLEITDESEDGVTCTMSAPGLGKMSLRYDSAWARRQGFAGKDTYKNNPREMHLKQCVKKLADRFASHVLMGMPGFDFSDEAPPAPPTALPPSGAEVVDAAPAPDPVDGLSKMIDQLWNGKKKMATVNKLRVVNAITKQMHSQERGYKSIDEVTPLEAQEMLDWLTAKYPKGHIPRGGEQDADAAPSEDEARGEGGAGAAVGADAPAAASSPSEEESVPLSEPEPEPEPEPTPEPERKPNPDEDVLTLLAMATRATKTHKGRIFVKKGPYSKSKSGEALYFVDYAIMTDLGWTAGKAIQADGVQVVDPAVCARLVKSMREAGCA